jgi:NADPH:quinone reductase-like Zn-dependent oxidoreductase
MRAFAVDGFGAPGSLHEIPTPDPGEGEVRIRVHAAGVNVMDPIFIAGWMKDYMEHRFPFIPGIDVSGVVEAVGPGVDSFALGDEVYGVSARPFVGAGTFAEQAVMPASGLARKPADLSHADAAALPHVALTALAVLDAAAPAPGQVIVLVGAAGGVGTIVSQLAAARGASVVGVTSAGSAAQTRQFGAAETIDYTAGDVAGQITARFPDGVDTLIDLHSDADELAAYASTVRSGGIVVTPRGPAGAAAPGIEQRGVRFANVNRVAPTRLVEISTAIAEGQLRVPPVTTFPLEAAADALAEMAAGHVRGKLVVVVD